MRGVFCGLAALFLALTPTVSVAQDGPYFELIDPPVLDDPKNWGGTWTVDNGMVTLSLNDGLYVGSFGWSVQAAFDASGFDLGLHVSGGVTCGPISVSTAAASNDFVFADDVTSVEAHTLSEGTYPDCQQAVTNNHAYVHIVPRAGTYAVGDKLEIHIGAAYGPGVLYVYTVTRAGTSDGKGGGVTTTTTTTGGDEGNGDDDEGTLDAVLDCPDSIVIGQLPGLQCAIEISGYERNTSAPVVVSSPTEVDGYGNTDSGIQLSVLTGAADPSNWDDSYHWPFSPFACAEGSPGVGANCYDNFAVPGVVTIPIIVSQEGVGTVIVPWTVTVLPGKTKTKTTKTKPGTGNDADGTDTFVFRSVAYPRGLIVSVSGLGVPAFTVGGNDNIAGRWYVITLDDGNAMICSVSDPIDCLHTENGALELGPVGNDWLSARWVLEPYDDTTFLIRNVWRSDQYVTMNEDMSRAVIKVRNPNDMGQVWSSQE